MPDLSTNELLHLLAVYGYLAVFAVIAVESAGIPLPGETMLMIASVYAGVTHELQVVAVIAAAAAGAIVGDNIGYVLGRVGGQAVLNRLGRYVGLNDRRLRLGRYLFLQRGGVVVFIGRFMAGLRMWAAFLAGANEMPWLRFLAWNAAGGIAWASLMGTLAYVFGADFLHVGGWLGIGACALALAVMSCLLLVARRNEERLQIEADRVLLAYVPVTR